MENRLQPNGQISVLYTITSSERNLMNKRFSVLLTVLAVLTVFTTSAFAAPAGKYVSLLSMNYHNGGITLLFETSGLSRADLKNNSFYANSNTQKMFCNFVDHTTTVRCTVSKALAGMSFHATLAGFGFLGELPNAPFKLVCTAGEIVWYTINLYRDGELIDSGDMPAHVWKELVGTGILEELSSAGIHAEIAAAFCAADISAAQ